MNFQYDSIVYVCKPANIAILYNISVNDILQSMHLYNFLVLIVAKQCHNKYLSLNHRKFCAQTWLDLTITNK